MATYYKPTEMRKRGFQSLDPDEPKRRRINLVKIVVVGIIYTTTLWLISRR